ncbi:septum formation initiator family protein [Microbulbifer thermotolerans]|uniref:Cell division protein FtsB n=1 Tax=Microbulbifer thermotolerans TaxID=252514 RepID=A0A143HNV4_MICTH|nr:septum formation initiator family protein [Microbulbifer thermotolerans]AMX02952.1 cell division protein FtsB [Microbulbifer thermotolerans]MCX2779870.1 septum formation initiator family protein [Microbulbifer thermotolerans]MCX2781609.1 septum formation initiator family protein [Microbulbifer thermotolerans]MCX2794768.1 septum formation initiator family protein [Microbulbifer thermotolerans]MCX2802324.1 septum formation initiator family protein [Microbulbifer thermotolerans]
MKWLLALLSVMLIATQFRLWVGEGSLAEVTRLKRELAEQRKKNAALLRENRQLLREVRSLKEGTDGVEAKARYDLGLIKEGETLFIFLDPEEVKKRD